MVVKESDGWVVVVHTDEPDVTMPPWCEESAEVPARLVVVELGGACEIDCALLSAE